MLAVIKKTVRIFFITHTTVRGVAPEKLREKSYFREGESVNSHRERHNNCCIIQCLANKVGRGMVEHNIRLDRGTFVHVCTVDFP